MSEFESFDYTKVTVAENQMSQYMDGYEHFGWKVDSNVPIEKGMGKSNNPFKAEQGSFK